MKPYINYFSDIKRIYYIGDTYSGVDWVHDKRFTRHRFRGIETRDKTAYMEWVEGKWAGILK